MKVQFTPEEERYLARSRTVEREAYDACLRSYAHWDDLSEESLNKTIKLNHCMTIPGFLPYLRK
ncbi:MAG: hypothetical protein AMS26_06340 [Bacteroides sp. SM23_62]|nr:MAG: hypothetical protein AMS26_06340 [Bacteroides sp. SM23_62]